MFPNLSLKNGAMEFGRVIRILTKNKIIRNIEQKTANSKFLSSDNERCFDEYTVEYFDVCDGGILLNYQ